MLRKIGNIKRPVGFRGDMLITDVPSAVKGLKPGCPVRIGYSGNFAADHVLRSMKRSVKGALLNIEGIADEKQVGKLKEMAVFADEEHILRKAAAYFEDELSGCRVLTDAGRDLGIIDEVWELPANDVWLIEGEDYTLPYPAAQNFIISVDKAAKKATVKDFPGLDELKEAKK